MLLRTLPKFLNCALLKDNSLLYSKIKKYFQRLLPSSYALIENEDFIRYLSIISFENIILSERYFLKHKSFLNKLKNTNIFILKESKNFKFVEEKNFIFIHFPKLFGFDEDKNILHSGLFLADDLAFSIINYINNKTPIFLGKSSNEISYKQKYCSLRFIYKNEANDTLFSTNVASFRMELARKLAKNIYFDTKDIDYIVPVPNTGIFYATGLCEVLKIPMLFALSKKSTQRAFEIENTDKRKSYLYKNISFNKDLLINKKIILVDEAIFTGATLKVVCDILQDIGVKEIHLCIPSPKCLTPCPYLMQPKRELLLEKINEKYLNTYFSVKSLSFLPFELYEESLQKINSKMCYECFIRRNYV